MEWVRGCVIGLINLIVVTGNASNDQSITYKRLETRSDYLNLSAIAMSEQVLKYVVMSLIPKSLTRPSLIVRQRIILGLSGKVRFSNLDYEDLIVVPSSYSIRLRAQYFRRDSLVLGGKERPGRMAFFHQSLRLVCDIDCVYGPKLYRYGECRSCVRHCARALFIPILLEARTQRTFCMAGAALITRLSNSCSVTFILGGIALCVQSALIASGSPQYRNAVL